MKQSAVSESGKEVQLRLVQNDSGTQAEDWSYAKELRTLGQALESHQLGTVELEVESGVYFVRGNATAADSARASLANLVRDFIFGSAPKAEQREGQEIKLRY